VNNFKIVAKNTFFLTLSEFFLKIIGVLWIVFLAHSLSVSEYGEYSFVNSFIAIFSFLPDLGIGIIVIREIARNKEKADLYLGNSLILNTSFAFIALVAIFITSFFLGQSQQTKTLIFIASITLFISTIRSVAIFFFDGMEKMHFSALLNSLNTVLLLAFAVFFGFVLNWGLKGVFLGMLFGTILSLFITWSIVLQKFIMPKVVINKKIMKHLFWEGLPLGIASFSFMVYTRIDSVILGNLLGNTSVGIYNSATPFAFSLIQLLNVPFMVAVFPALSRIEKEDKQRFKKVLKRSIFFIIAWSLPVSILISLFSPIFLPFVFGKKYEAAIPVLKILIFFVPFASLSALLYKVLIILNKQMLYLYISIIGALINVAFNFYLIPKYLILGAAYASVGTQLFLFLIYSMVVFKLVKGIKK